MVRPYMTVYRAHEHPTATGPTTVHATTIAHALASVGAALAEPVRLGSDANIDLSPAVDTRDERGRDRARRSRAAHKAAS